MNGGQFKGEAERQGEGEGSRSPTKLSSIGSEVSWHQSLRGNKYRSATGTEVMALYGENWKNKRKYREGLFRK